MLTSPERYVFAAGAYNMRRSTFVCLNYTCYYNSRKNNRLHLHDKLINDLLVAVILVKNEHYGCIKSASYRAAQDLTVF